MSRKRDNVLSLKKYIHFGCTTSSAVFIYRIHTYIYLLLLLNVHIGCLFLNSKVVKWVWITDPINTFIKL